jgi:hypothetical protein
MTDHRSKRFKKHTNTWPITGNNDSTSTVIYMCACWIVVACDRSCICLLVELLLPVIGHVFVCFLNRCCLGYVMYLCACWIVVACYRSCICLLMESLLPLIGHVFVCLLNRCGLCTVMYLSASGIVVACDRSCICLYMIDHRPQRFNKHTNTWPITGNNDSIRRQILDR